MNFIKNCHLAGFLLWLFFFLFHSFHIFSVSLWKCVCGCFSKFVVKPESLRIGVNKKNIKSSRRFNFKIFWLFFWCLYLVLVFYGEFLLRVVSIDNDSGVVRGWLGWKITKLSDKTGHTTPSKNSSYTQSLHFSHKCLSYPVSSFNLLPNETKLLLR